MTRPATSPPGSLRGVRLRRAEAGGLRRGGRAGASSLGRVPVLEPYVGGGPYVGVQPYIDGVRVEGA